MADTGCQSCLASMTVVRRFGLREADLIPVTMHMHAANNNGIKIIGAVIIRFSGNSTSGQPLETRQIVYVTHDSDKLFLSREACTALGLISPMFPTVGENSQQPAEPDITSATTNQTSSMLDETPTTAATAHVAAHHHPSPQICHSQPPRTIETTYNNGSLTIINQAPSTLVSIKPYPQCQASPCD